MGQGSAVSSVVRGTWCGLFEVIIIIVFHGRVVRIHCGRSTNVIVFVHSFTFSTPFAAERLRPPVAIFGLHPPFLTKMQGRKTMHIVAACVYIVCRQQKVPIMLIDISDKLAVNVYVLGKVWIFFCFWMTYRMHVRLARAEDE